MEQDNVNLDVLLLRVYMRILLLICALILVLMVTSAVR